MNMLQIVSNVTRFKEKADRLLAKYETSTSRVLDLTKTYQQLSGMSIQQDDLLRQALRCTEHQLYRAAHVMAWAGFMDFLERKIVEKGFRKLHKLYPAWSSYKTVEDLRERVPEFQLIEAAGRLNLCTKNQVRALHGLLNKRNECAHPSDFYPGLNESLGYISELLQRISQIQPK